MSTKTERALQAANLRRIAVARRMLATDWRLWAVIPATVRALEFLVPIDRGADAGVAIVRRPTFPRGVCRTCGCTEHDPCPEGCAWTSRAETLCTACKSIAASKEPT